MAKRFVIMLAACFLALGGLHLVLPSKAQACSCAMPAAVKEELERKTAVFSGKVLRVEQPTAKPVMSSMDPVKITFQVNTVWKGQVKAEETVYTAMSSASCGYDKFAVQKEYIVFAGGTPEHLETNICTRTKSLASAGEELAILGTGSAPIPASAVESTGSGLEAAASAARNAASSKAVWSLVILLTGASVFLAARRRRFLRKK